MSKNDKIGALVCALPGMNPEYLGVLQDVAARLNNNDRKLALAWRDRFAGVLAEGLPKFPRLRYLAKCYLRSAVAAQKIVSANDVFESVGQGFDKIVGLPTPDKTEGIVLDLYEQCVDATPKNLFETLGRPLEQLCLNETQIVQFARTRLDLLARRGMATFFLLRGPDSLCYVVSVGFDGSELLEAGIEPVSSSAYYVLRHNNPRNRLVVPAFSE